MILEGKQEEKKKKEEEVEEEGEEEEERMSFLLAFWAQSFDFVAYFLGAWQTVGQTLSGKLKLRYTAARGGVKRELFFSHNAYILTIQTF